LHRSERSRRRIGATMDLRRRATFGLFSGGVRACVSLAFPAPATDGPSMNDRMETSKSGWPTPDRSRDVSTQMAQTDGSGAFLRTGDGQVCPSHSPIPFSRGAEKSSRRAWRVSGAAVGRKVSADVTRRQAHNPTEAGSGSGGVGVRGQTGVLFTPISYRVAASLKETKYDHYYEIRTTSSPLPAG
jgi:hypothetical protein